MLSRNVLKKVIPLLTEALDSEPKFISVEQIGFAADGHPFASEQSPVDADFDGGPIPMGMPQRKALAEDQIFPSPISRMIELHSIRSIAQDKRGTLILLGTFTMESIIVSNPYQEIAEVISQL